MELARAPKREKTVTIQKQKPYEYTIAYIPPGPERRIHFSSKEIKHLTIAALLVMGIGLSLGIYPGAYSEIGGALMLVIFALIITASFFMHEIAHKIAAQRRGLWAEFRLIFTGVILTFISIISPIFKIISPGAVMIAGLVDEKNVGKISVAGPLTNTVLSAMLLAVGLLQRVPLFLYGAAFNAWIALFNLIPFGIFDGFKVFRWNKAIWALAFTVSLALTIISFSYYAY
jgi:Zn-dependent protease